MVYSPDHNHGGRIFNRLSPEKRRFFEQTAGLMAIGQVLTHHDFTEILYATEPERILSSMDIRSYMGTQRTASMYAHLNVVLFSSRYGQPPLLTYYDLQINPSEIAIRDVAERRRIASIGSIQKTSGDVEQWLQAAENLPTTTL